jgi:hypothetical protein
MRKRHSVLIVASMIIVGAIALADTGTRELPVRRWREEAP